MSTEAKKQPEDAKNYPPSPSIERVETEGCFTGRPSQVRITVKYFSHEGGADPFKSTVHYSVRNGVAKIRDISGDGKLVDQLSAILFTEAEVCNVQGVDEVKRLNQETGTAMKFIGQCTQNE